MKRKALSSFTDEAEVVGEDSNDGEAAQRMQLHRAKIPQTPRCSPKLAKASAPKLPAYWGPLQVVSGLTAGDFWALIDELKDDRSGFLYNRAILLDAWKNGCLHGLAVEETDDMFKSPERRGEPLFCKNSDTMYLLPCLLMTGEDAELSTVEIIWTHKRARRKGLGTELVQKLGIKKVYNPLEGSAPFWKACGLY